MDDLNVIDQFTETFVAYIESGFGLLGPDIAFLTTILVAIDVTLAGLFWALSEDKSVIPSLIKKVLYVGAFAFILNNFSLLADIIFSSFAEIGLKASDSPITADDLMHPGFVAAAGYDAAAPLLEEIQDLLGPISFFENFLQISVLWISWLIVLLAFFILAIQLFITILEFKLTTLAGFVLVPFALWNKSSFIAERVMGNVVSAGIKLMVLAIIVGIGSTLFGSFADSFTGDEVTIEQALSVVLGALSILVLGIFGPGIASGLVAGAPQLGAGSVAAPAAGLALGGAAVAGAAVGGGRLAMAAAGRATRAAASVAGGARSSYELGRTVSGRSGAAGTAAGTAGMAKAGAGAAGKGVRDAGDRLVSGIRESYQSGERGGFTATGGTLPETPPPQASMASPDTPPAWADRLRRGQRLREGVTIAAHTIRDGDRPGSAESPRLGQED